MPAKQPDKLIPIETVAELIGLSPKTIYAGDCGTDELLRIPLGSRKVNFSYNDVMAWIERRKAEAIQARERQIERRRSLLNQPRLNKQTIVTTLRDFKSKRAITN